jgi:hypothetical protein
MVHGRRVVPPWSAEVRLPEPNWSTSTFWTPWTSLCRRRPTVRSISTGSTWAPPPSRSVPTVYAAFRAYRSTAGQLRLAHPRSCHQKLEKAPPNTLNESRSAYGENTLVLQPIPSLAGIQLPEQPGGLVPCSHRRSPASRPRQRRPAACMGLRRSGTNADDCLPLASLGRV